MQVDPREFANFVEAGARVDKRDRPVPDERAEKRKRDRDAPHADGKRVHVEQRVAAGAVLMQRPIM